MVTSIFNWMSGFLVSPWLFLLGVVLIAAPMIIHLLNRRRYHIVDWAAMDFLLDADRQNRRRLRLENLLLLLLRCLAVLLVGLLLARPFGCNRLAPLLRDAGQTERIVLLDDSLSMQARTDNSSSLGDARGQLAELIFGLSANRTDDTLTLLLASQPDRPLYHSRGINPDTKDEIVKTVLDIEGSDMSSNLHVSLQELQRHIAAQPSNVNRVVYVWTDMRERDWNLAGPLDAPNQPAHALRRLAKDVADCYLIDVGHQDIANVVITDIRSEETLVAGVSSRFDVTVANRGNREVRDVAVQFFAGQPLPLEAQIDAIAPGQSETTTFRFTFSAAAAPISSPPSEHPTALAATELASADMALSRKVHARVALNGAANNDRLAADSTRYLAARVVAGIPALIVDGDPSAVFGRAESFYLQPALAPPGDARSGVIADVVTETEFETIELNPYEVIFLCNLYRPSPRRIAAVERWVREGGGLVLMPGDQVDEDFFNEHFHRGGRGLSPLRLDGLRGDESERTWVNFRVENASHDVLRIFQGQDNPFLNRVKIFRWWGATVIEQQRGTSVSVLARLTDLDESVVMAERAVGEGRVVAIAIPADADWTNWPDDPSYLITAQELVRYLTGDVANRGTVRVGQSIRYPLDLTAYQRQAVFRYSQHDVARRSGADTMEFPVQAMVAENPGDTTSQALWHVDSPQTQHSGFYDLELSRKTRGKHHVLFAANVDPEEGDLRRIDMAAFRRNMKDSRVTIVGGQSAVLLETRGNRGEWWLQILLLLTVVLAIEQLSGWWFGRRR